MTDGMAGKVVLVTGATDGIGRETARRIAALGATTVIAGRNPDKGARVASELQRECGNERVEFLAADLSRQAEVRALAAAFKARHPRLDVLLNNAGALFFGRKESADGIEMTFALNHLNYFLLTHELSDILRDSAPARIVNVASAAHLRAALDFDDLQHARRYRAWKAYSRSKLANVLFTYETARRLAGTGVTANCLHPGFVRSQFGNDNALPGRLGIALAKRFGGAISIAEGAETSVFVATAPELERESGLYFSRSRPQASSVASHDEIAQRRLWKASSELVGL